MPRREAGRGGGEWRDSSGAMVGDATDLTGANKANKVVVELNLEVGPAVPVVVVLLLLQLPADIPIQLLLSCRRSMPPTRTPPARREH